MALGLCILMGIDRIYVGAHYPTDVIAGLALGGSIGLLLARPATAALSELFTRFGSGPLRGLVFAGDRS